MIWRTLTQAAAMLTGSACLGMPAGTKTCGKFCGNLPKDRPPWRTHPIQFDQNGGVKITMSYSSMDAASLAIAQFAHIAGRGTS